MRVLVTAVLVGVVALPGTAGAAPVGPRCSFVVDPSELRSDIAGFVVTAGPIRVDEPGVTAVTVTCSVLADGARAASVSATQSGSVGYVVGRTSVGTFTGPTLTFCTEIAWTGSTSGSFTDCPDVS